MILQAQISAFSLVAVPPLQRWRTRPRLPVQMDRWVFEAQQDEGQHLVVGPPVHHEAPAVYAPTKEVQQKVANHWRSVVQVDDLMPMDVAVFPWGVAASSNYSSVLLFLVRQRSIPSSSGGRLKRNNYKTDQGIHHFPVEVIPEGQEVSHGPSHNGSVDWLGDTASPCIPLEGTYSRADRVRALEIHSQSVP